MFEEKNTANNLPAQIDIAAGSGDEYHFTLIQKGGGSANKTFLYQNKSCSDPGRAEGIFKRGHCPAWEQPPARLITSRL